MSLPWRSSFRPRHTATNCQQPHKPASSGLRLTLCSRQRTSRPCSLVQPVSCSEGKKIFGELGLSTLQNAALVADRKSTRLNSSHGYISYAVFCLKKKTKLLLTRTAYRLSR